MNVADFEQVATAEWDALVAAVEGRFAEPPAAAPTNLVPTPDASIWYDPATGALVRIPAATRTPTPATPPSETPS